MISDKERKKEPKQEAEEIKEILSVVSKEVPGLIKGILGTVFSEEAGKNMGKAAAAFYKELKDSGMPEETAVKMTEEYMGTFTSLGDMLKNIGTKKSGSVSIRDVGEEISREIKLKLKEKEEEKEEDED